MFKNVLSPWAEVDFANAEGLCPYPATLEGKTIGLFAHFKQHSPIMLAELQKLLAARLPDTKFTQLQYPRDTMEVCNDSEFDPVLKQWLKGVDVVIAAYGDAGSCAMFHAYNTAYIEKLGVPAVMLVKRDLQKPAQRGAAARLVPALRFVPCDMADLSHVPDLESATLEKFMRPFLPQVVEPLIEAMTRPLTEAESAPPTKNDAFSKMTFDGDYETINNAFYQHGWTNGTPICPPTAEAVEKMLRGTDLPRDYVVGCIPPMLGKATVEKIAINGVMAGCLPTYMPVLIAAVRGMLDPKIHLEGWTCSVSTWAPLITVSGPVAKALHMNSKGAFLSPYFKASACIGRAVAYMIMNIGGVRPILEDMSEMGHESRFGIVVADSCDENPWGPLHTDYGFEKSDSCVSMFWPTTHEAGNASSAESLLESMCATEASGWAPGCAFVMNPNAARLLADYGMSRQDVLDYVVEYSRIPGANVPLRWISGNNHLPESVHLPASPKHWTRRFWDKEHLFIVVGGSSYGSSLHTFTGGGDHGGPSVTKIELPKSWDALCAEYDGLVPEYINY